MFNIYTKYVLSFLRPLFTGIIESTAKVINISNSSLTIERPKIFDDIRVGSSICVSGVCLSIIEFDDVSMSFDLLKETMDKSSFGSLRQGSALNLERALKADGRFEGHIIQGHTEAAGKVVKIPNATSEVMLVQIPKELNKFCVQKGSIALDGVSLTIASINNNLIGVALIPHTLKNTTLGIKKEGDKINIETDILGRY
jgi:riboflavin synthase